MLKFRMTNSMKARRAAEAQRKALEEKLKMEWAWKPMAAVMNEKESDLVYWVPPIYTSRFFDSFPSTSSSTIETSPYSSKRSSLTNPSAPSTPNLHARRRRLAQRRARLSARQNSIQEVQSDTHEEDCDEKKKKEDVHTDEDRESGIQDEFLDSSLEEDIITEGSFNRTNKLKHSLKKLDRPTKLPDRKEKFRHIPTLLKVINKLSHIYTLPMSPRPPMYGSSDKSLKQKEIKVEQRKPKRPSVKIYRVPSTRSSIRKNTDEEDPPFYAISKNKYPFGSQKRFSLQSQNSTTIERTHIGLPTLTETELRKAHLEMILRILTNLYEEKLIVQNTEIAQLKSKLLLQEKVVKQTAHLVIDMKEQMRTLQAKYDFNEELKTFYKNSKNDPESSFDYERLEPLFEENNDSVKFPNSSNIEENNSDIINILHVNSSQSDIAEDKMKDVNSQESCTQQIFKEKLHRQVFHEKGKQKSSIQDSFDSLRQDSCESFLQDPYELFRHDSCESLRQDSIRRSPRQDSSESFRQVTFTRSPRASFRHHYLSKANQNDSYESQDSVKRSPRKASNESFRQVTFTSTPRQDSLKKSYRQDSCDSSKQVTFASSSRQNSYDSFRQDSCESLQQNSYEGKSNLRSSDQNPRREYVRQIVRQLEPSQENQSTSYNSIIDQETPESHISVLNIKIT